MRRSCPLLLKVLSQSLDKVCAPKNILLHLRPLVEWGSLVLSNQSFRLLVFFLSVFAFPCRKTIAFFLSGGLNFTYWTHSKTSAQNSDTTFYSFKGLSIIIKSK